MTRERDDLAKLLAAAHSKEAGLTDALQLMSEKATETGEELESARKKIKEDEEAIALLRAKVEESRYVPPFPQFPSRLELQCMSKPRVLQARSYAPSN
jgi:hypothetical protein